MLAWASNFIGFYFYHLAKNEVTIATENFVEFIEVFLLFGFRIFLMSKVAPDPKTAITICMVISTFLNFEYWLVQHKFLHAVREDAHFSIRTHPELAEGSA